MNRSNRNSSLRGRMRCCAPVVAAVLITASLGCGAPSCVDLCVEEGEGGCAVAVGGDACESHCRDLTDTAERSGCGVLFDAVLSCEGGGDVCTATERCRGEINSYNACLVEYCRANPTDPVCP